VTEKSGMPGLFDLWLGAPVLIAADPAGRMYRIDPDLGTLTLLSDTGILGIGGMAWQPAYGRVVAGTGYSNVEGPGGGWIYAVDPFTGHTGTMATQDDTGVTAILDMATDPGSGTVLSVVDAQGEGEWQGILWHDPMTMEVGYDADTPYMPGVAGSLALAIDGSGLMFLSGNIEGPELWFADPNNYYGSYDLWGGIAIQTVLGNDLGGPVVIQSLAASPEVNILYGIASLNLPWPQDAFLVKVDLEAWTATYVAPLPMGMDGLAFVGEGRPAYPPVQNFYAFNWYPDIGMSARPYPAAESMNIYWAEHQDLSGSVEVNPSDPATYDGVFTCNNDFSGCTFTGGTANTWYSFKAAAVVNDAVVATSVQWSVYLENVR